MGKRGTAGIFSREATKRTKARIKDVRDQKAVSSNAMSSRWWICNRFWGKWLGLITELEMTFSQPTGMTRSVMNCQHPDFFAHHQIINAVNGKSAQANAPHIREANSINQRVFCQ